jgi:hypothetical protein
MTAVHDPVDWTTMSLGKVIRSWPPVAAMPLLSTIVNLYSATCPTTIFPVGAVTATEVKEFATKAKLAVELAVPESIKYPSVV